MANIRSSIAAGVVATVVAGSMILMNHAIHRLPDIGIGPLLADLLGASQHVAVGWLAFIVLGVVVFSFAFAFLAPRIPVQSYLVKGLVFGLVTWLALMLIGMPLEGAGMFGLNRGHVVAIAALVLCIAYWVVLSLVYRWTSATAEPTNAVAEQG